MVTAIRRTAAVLVACTGLLAAGFAGAAEIRFYKVNDKGQQREIGFIGNRDEPGCHNMLRSPDVFRVAQVGFVYCSVYAGDDCPDSGALVMNWKGKVKKNSARAQPTDRILPGSMWYFGDNEEREIRSFKCVP